MKVSQSNHKFDSNMAGIEYDTTKIENIHYSNEHINR